MGSRQLLLLFVLLIPQLSGDLDVPHMNGRVTQHMEEHPTGGDLAAVDGGNDRVTVDGVSRQ